MYKLQASRRFKEEEDIDDDSSGSDFDDDDDPDKIEVPGGGKDLATMTNMLNHDTKPVIKKEPMMGLQMGGQQVRMPNKIPGGLVTKGNSAPGFEMVRGNTCKYFLNSNKSGNYFIIMGYLLKRRAISYNFRLYQI